MHINTRNASKHSQNSRLANKSTTTMTTQLQQPKSVETTVPKMIEEATPADLPMLPPAQEADAKSQDIFGQISVYLADMPDYIGRFFNNYKQPITNIALIVAAIISVRVLIAILGALKGVPLVLPTFELIGIGYSIWFVKRYLLNSSDRQELLNKLQEIKQQMFGNEQQPNSQS